MYSDKKKTRIQIVRKQSRFAWNMRLGTPSARVKTKRAEYNRIHDVIIPCDELVLWALLVAHPTALVCSWNVSIGTWFSDIQYGDEDFLENLKISPARPMLIDPSSSDTKCCSQLG